MIFCLREMHRKVCCVSIRIYCNDLDESNFLFLRYRDKARQVRCGEVNTDDDEVYTLCNVLV